VKVTDDREQLKRDCSSGREAGALWKFVKEVHPGDTILVKEGRRALCMAGVVVAGRDGKTVYKHDSAARVDGWDLRHTIEVEWYEFISKEANQRILRPDATLPVIRFSHGGNATNEGVRRVLESGNADGFFKDNDKLFKRVSPTGVYRELKISLPAAFKLTAEEDRLLWSERVSTKGLETFRKIFFVVPFLRRLGWPAEMMEFEKSVGPDAAIDIVLYEDFAHSKPWCIVETKAAGAALASLAIQQAERYAGKIEAARSLKLLLATDGIRYVGKTMDDGNQGDIFEIDRQSGLMSSENALDCLHPTTFPSVTD